MSRPNDLPEPKRINNTRETKPLARVISRIQIEAVRRQFCMNQDAWWIGFSSEQTLQDFTRHKHRLIL